MFINYPKNIQAIAHKLSVNLTDSLKKIYTYNFGPP